MTTANTPSPSAAERVSCKECEREKDKLRDAYFQDQTIAPDGQLRPTFSRLVERAASAEAELSRIRTLLDREKLANLIYQYLFPCPGGAPRLNSYELADKLRSSLLGSGPEGE